MGKKGVIMDNGKNAQSSMALYWKKHNENSKKPKKQYQQTQQQQLDQRVQSGFQKWKLHKDKLISKAYTKKQQKNKKEAQQNQHEKQQKQRQEQEQFDEQLLMSKKLKKEPVSIPGFRSKQALTHRLRPQSSKQVDQSSNILKLPSHMFDVNQDDILRILREKKFKQDLAKRNKKEQEDVILGDDFLLSFKQPPPQKQKQKQQDKDKDQQPIQQQQHFFKSDLLNKFSKGVNILALQKEEAERVQNQLMVVQKKYHQDKMAAQEAVRRQQQIKVRHQAVESSIQKQPIKLLFKPRVLNRPNNSKTIHNSEQ